MIGSPLSDDKGFSSGSAYLFAIKETPEPSTVLSLLAFGTLGLFKGLGKQKR